jgi:hypothetical protein
VLCAVVLTHCSTVHFCARRRVDRVMISAYSKVSALTKKIVVASGLLSFTERHKLPSDDIIHETCDTLHNTTCYT